MKGKISPGRHIARTMTAAIALCIILSCAIMPAAAKAPPNFFDGGSWDGSKQPLQPLPGQNAVGTITLEPVVVPTPPYSTDNPQARALYLGSCSIGTGNAPQLRQTSLSSGAQCRGACGIDCPPERCKAVADITISFEGGTYIYKNVISCPSHQGCRDHDACYDICTEQLGDSSLLLGTCHGICNGRCYDEWNYPDCILWAALPGTLSSSASGMVDSTMIPIFDKNLIFSDTPQFKPSVTPTDQYPGFAKLALHYTATRYAVTDSSSFDPDCGYADKAYEISGKDPFARRPPATLTRSSCAENPRQSASTPNGTAGSTRSTHITTR
jgi:hypothetical protein